MGVVIRQSFKSTLVLYIGAVFGLISRLFLLPNFLTLEQLGLLDLLLYLSMILLKFSNLGTTSSITKFYSYFKEKKLLGTFSGVIFLAPIVGFILFASIFYFFKENIVHLFPENNWDILSKFYNYLFPLAIFMMYKEITTLYSVNNLRLTVPTIINDLFVRIIGVFLLLLIGYQIINFNEYVLLWIISYGIATIMLFVYCLKLFQLKIRIDFKSISDSDYKEIAKYSLFIFFAGLSGLISQYTDSIMLASIKGLEISGIYSVAFYIGLSIELPKRAITSISSSIIADNWNKNDLNAIDKIYKQSSINQGVIGFFLLILIVVNLDEVFYLLPKTSILSTGKTVAVIIATSRLIDMITGVNAEILRTSKYYTIDFYLLIFFIGVSILSNYILIPILGINGAAYATLFSVIVYDTIRFILLKKLFNLNPFTIKTVYLIGISLALIFIHLITPEFRFSNYFACLLIILGKSLFYGGLFLIVIYKMKISKEINQLIQKTKSRIIR